MKKDKEITINELAQIVESGFKQSKKSDADLDSKINNLAQTIDDLSSATAKGFEDVENRLSKKIEVEIKSVRDDLGHKVDHFRSEILGAFRSIEKRIDAIEIRLGRMEKNNIDEIELLSGDVVLLKSKVLKLEQKIAKLKLANS